MVNANELRIGNIVQDFTNIETRVTGNLIDSLSRIEDDGFAPSPIPLDDNWLTRFGFEKKGTSYDEAVHLGPFHIQFEGGKGYFLRLYAGYIMKTPIKYVHQLQNLYFAITEHELELTAQDLLQ